MKHIRIFSLYFTLLLTAAVLLVPDFASAVVPAPGPSNSSLGLEATIPSDAPKNAASIATPSNGAVFTSIPITVSGLCTTGLLVKVFANNVFVGSTVCAGGSYELQVDLFSGRNDIVTRVYDALDQAGPDSNIVTVTFNDAQFEAFGARVGLNSDYARRGANPGEELDWPITISSGTPPYALSVDWGDGKPADLQSVPFADTITLKHVYAVAGTYHVIVKVTDSKGTAAFLQLVGVANGAVQANVSGSKSTSTVKTVVVWWPLLLFIPLILAAFWLGQRHELYTLRRHLEESVNQ
jgi:hypothetical protein